MAPRNGDVEVPRNRPDTACDPPSCCVTLASWAECKLTIDFKYENTRKSIFVSPCSAENIRLGIDGHFWVQETRPKRERKGSFKETWKERIGKLLALCKAKDGSNPKICSFGDLHSTNGKSFPCLKWCKTVLAHLRLKAAEWAADGHDSLDYTTVSLASYI